MSVYSKLIYRCNESESASSKLLAEIHQLISEFLQKLEGPTTGRESRGSLQANLGTNAICSKLHCERTIMKTVCYWQNSREINP
jgi:hypothetical protein